MSTPYVILSNGLVDDAGESVVFIDMDYLIRNDPASTNTGEVQLMLRRLVWLKKEGRHVDNWIDACNEWLVEHHRANDLRPVVRA